VVPRISLEIVSCGSLLRPAASCGHWTDPHQPATVATCRYKTDSLTKCPKNSQILQKLQCLLLSISSGQLVLWREQLVLEDTKRGFLRPCIERDLPRRVESRLTWISVKILFPMTRDGWKTSRRGYTPATDGDCRPKYFRKTVSAYWPGMALTKRPP